MTTLSEDLTELRRLKDVAEEEGRDKKEADAKFKKWQVHCLRRMEVEGAKRHGTDEYLFTAVTTKVKGQIEDRRLYVRWALVNDDSIQDFLDWVEGYYRDDGDMREFEQRFFDAITSTSLVSYKEDGHVMNQQARAHIDDGAELPPGLTFRPDPSIQMRKS